MTVLHEVDPESDSPWAVNQRDSWCIHVQKKLRTQATRPNLYTKLELYIEKQNKILHSNDKTKQNTYFAT